MAKSKWMKKFLEMDGAITDEAFNPHANVIQTPSPSINFCFGKAHGLPAGYSAIFYGPPGGGKSLLANATAGQLHKDDLDAVVMKFDTEYRETGQMPMSERSKWGIDNDRYICIQSNNPMDVFDTIEKNVVEACQDGEKIRLIIIDSLTGIRGRRSLDQDGVEKQQIGDEALTIQTGLKRILGVQRKYNIGMIMTAHVAAEMDQTEQMRGNKVRMVAGFGAKHHTEYFLYIEHNQTAAARKSLLDAEYKNENLKDVAGNEEKTAHKIRACMKKNSMAVAGRVGEFTLDYNNGIVNTYEEVFLLGTNRGIIQRPTAQTYEFAGKKWVGKAQMVMALRDYPELAAEVVKQLRLADIEGKIGQTAEEAASVDKTLDAD